MELNLIYDILTELGLKLVKDNDGFRTNAIWRNGDNVTAVKVWSDGKWRDFVTQEGGNFRGLIKLILNEKSEEKITEFLKAKNLNILDLEYKKEQEPQLKMPKFLNSDILSEIKPDYSYGISRGISLDTLNLFQTGVIFEGRMKNRFVIPIFDINNRLIGLTGRDLGNDKKIKWKHLGAKGQTWIFPIHLNDRIIRDKKRIFLVESPFCVLKMWDAGVKNVICLFGLELSLCVLNYLLKLDLEKIYIATNNEESGRGNDAALKIEKKLKKYFDKSLIQIALPKMKDFGEMSCIEIQKYYNNII